MKKFFKKFSIIISVLALLLVATNVNATGLLKDTKNLDGGSTGGNTQQFIETSNLSPSMKIGNIAAAGIKAFLGLLGIIFVFLLVLGGYKYMIARGDEAKVEEAIAIIRRAIVGLIIVVSAYAVTYYVFSNLDGGGSSGGGWQVEEE